MKNRIFVSFLISCLLVGCSSSLGLVQLNNIFIKENRPLSDWAKDLLRVRTKAFEKLNVNLDNADEIYLIETYNLEGLYYDGLLYLDENQYYHFYRKGIGAEVDVLNQELTETEKYIIEELKNYEYDRLKEKSIKSNLITPISLYVTVVNNRAKKRIEFFMLRSFYVD